MNRFDVVVESYDRQGSIAWLRLGRTKLAARPWPGLRTGAMSAVRLRPEDVILCEGHPGRTSARNVLPGHIRSIRYVPEGVLVRLDVGFPLTSLVTRRAVSELGLARRQPIFALVKATAVTPDVRFDARIRVSLVGDRGTIEPQKIDFLRLLDRAGSLSAAARERGVSFRTAWLWVKAANRAWGRPLVALVQGGKGGGGAVLTPEGEAALRFVAAVERSKGSRS